jgi:hypothetical protein
MYYKPLLIPLLIQVGLTFAVWFRMYHLRIREMSQKHIDPQQVSTRTRGREVLVDSAAAADNVMNQFEMPVLFYAAILLALNLMWQDPLFVTFCWMFVIFRVIHCVIHTTYNNVLHRFWAYAFSCGALFGLWIRLGMYIISV